MNDAIGVMGFGVPGPEMAPRGTKSIGFAKGFFQASNLPEHQLLVGSFAGIMSKVLIKPLDGRERPERVIVLRLRPRALRSFVFQ